MRISVHFPKIRTEYSSPEEGKGDGFIGLYWRGKGRACIRMSHLNRPRALIISV